MELTIVLSDEQLELVAARAAELVLERLPVSGPPVSPWMSVEEAAGHLRSTSSSVHDWIRRGRLTRHKVGSKVLLDRREVEALVVVDGVAHLLPSPPRVRSGSGVAA